MEDVVTEIKKRCSRESDCLFWNVNKKKRVHLNNKSYCPHKVIWDFYNSNDPYDYRRSVISSTCQSAQICYNPSHMVKRRKDDEEAALKKFIEINTSMHGECLIWNHSIMPVWKGRNLRLIIYEKRYPLVNASTGGFLAECKNVACLEPEHMILNSPKCKEELYRKILYYSSKSTDDCITYNGSVETDGYAKFVWLGKSFMLHRLVYWIHSTYENIEDLPGADSGLQVCHHCRHKICVNPSHYSLETRSVNNYEHKIMQGTHKIGIHHNRATITEATAKKIILSRREKTDPEYRSQTKRAVQFGVTKSIINSIDQKITWRHLHEDIQQNTTAFMDKRKRARQYNEDKQKSICSAQQYDVAKKRLLSRTQVNPHTGCHEMKKTTKRYGSISVLGRQISAHVLACEIQVGGRKLGKGMCARHYICDNKLCANPAHMREGSCKENVQDRRKSDSNGKKLKAQDVRQIRTLLQHLTPIEDIAKIFNVSVVNIRSIKNGKIWSHI